MNQPPRPWLPIGGIDPGTNKHRLSEIEWRTLNILAIHRWNQRQIDGGKLIRVDHHHLIQNRAMTGTGKIETRSIGQINDGILVGNGGIVDPQLVVILIDAVCACGTAPASLKVQNCRLCSRCPTRAFR